jgi:O-antigen/teichoic acid export membrane protein
MIFDLYKKISRLFKNSDLLEVAKKTVSYLSINIIGVVLLFLLTAFITNSYGSGVWGTFALFFNYVNLISLISNLGLDIYGVKLNSGYLVEQDDEGIRKFWNKTILINFILSVVIMFLHFIFYEFLSPIYFDQNTPSLIMIVLAIAIPIFTFYNLFIAYLRGFKETGLSGLLRNTLIWLFTLLLFLSLLKFNLQNIISLSLSYLFSGLLCVIISILYIIKLKKLYFFNNMTYYLKGKKEFFGILKLSFPFLLIYIVHASNLSFDKIIIKNLLSISDVGIYDVVLRINSIPNLIFVASNAILMPKFSELYEKGNHEELKALAKNSTKIIFWLSVPILIFLLCFKNLALGIFGDEFVIGSSLLTIMLIGQFLMITTGSAEVLLQMTNNQSIFQWIFVLSMVINILGCYVLIPMFGLIGAGIAKVLSVLSWRIISTIIASKKTGISTFYIPLFFNIK